RPGRVQGITNSGKGSNGCRRNAPELTTKLTPRPPGYARSDEIEARRRSRVTSPQRGEVDLRALLREASRVRGCARHRESLAPSPHPSPLRGEGAGRALGARLLPFAAMVELCVEPQRRGKTGDELDQVGLAADAGLLEQSADVGPDGGVR